MLVCHQRVQNNSIPSFIYILIHIQCMTAVSTSIICPRLLIGVQTGNYKIQTQLILFCILNPRFYVNYRCLGMYFLIRQAAQINLKTMLCLMSLQSACSNTGGLKFWEQQTFLGRTRKRCYMLDVWVRQWVWKSAEVVMDQSKVLGVGED